MPTCDKCGQDGPLFYGLCSDCRKKLMLSIPILPTSNSEQDLNTKTFLHSQHQEKLLRDDNIKLTSRIGNVIIKNKLGSTSLFLDLIALILMLLFQNLYIGLGIAVYAIIFGYISIRLEKDEKLKFAGLGILIGAIIVFVGFLPLIISIITILSLFF